MSDSDSNPEPPLNNREVDQISPYNTSESSPTKASPTTGKRRAALKSAEITKAILASTSRPKTAVNLTQSSEMAELTAKQIDEIRDKVAEKMQQELAMFKQDQQAKFDTIHEQLQRILDTHTKDTLPDHPNPAESSAIPLLEDVQSIRSFQLASGCSDNCLRPRNDQVTVDLFTKSGIEFNEKNKYHPHRFVQIFENATANADVDERCRTMLFRSAIKIQSTKWLDRALATNKYEELKNIFIKIFWDEAKQSDALYYFKTYQGDPKASLSEIISELQLWQSTLKKIEQIPGKLILNYLYEKIPHKYKKEIAKEGLINEKVLFDRLETLTNFQNGHRSGVRAWETRIFYNDSQKPSGSNAQPSETNVQNNSSNTFQRGDYRRGRYRGNNYRQHYRRNYDYGNDGYFQRNNYVENRSQNAAANVQSTNESNNPVPSSSQPNSKN